MKKQKRVYQQVYLQNIDAAVYEARELRAKYVSLGRPDLARDFVVTPTPLRDLADYLWLDKPLVTSESFSAQTRSTPPSANFKKEFRLVRRDGAPGNSEDGFICCPAEWRRRDESARHLADSFAKRLSSAWSVMWMTKKNSDLREQIAKAEKAGKPVAEKSLVRKWALETIWRNFPLEEWATVFPDAALAGDLDFIQEIVRRFKGKDDGLHLATDYLPLAFYWHEFPGAAQVPPLKHWRDKAACEFIRFFTGKSVQALTIERYKRLKRKLGLHIEKPILVSWTEYKRSGMEHVLTARR